jgi:hypothetical protein
MGSSPGNKRGEKKSVAMIPADIPPRNVIRNSNKDMGL